ncbi:MAG TPA: PadR family transcriptional regulator [Stellaceae bacterium]|nr:PadR family transcriptional regulator [Stellaceae bacterium]
MMEHRYGHRHAHGMFSMGGGRFGGHRHGGGRGGRLGRFFDHGDLRYVLLGLIAERPRHGYELIKAIEEKFGGMYSPSPGVVYPTLTLLEELGYIRPDSTEGPRKQFVVTPEGTAFLAANRAVVDQIFARMAEIGRLYAGGPAPEIRRAMHNLEAALTIRLGRGPLSAEQVRAVTTILDRTASEIEQS